jgi:hypothetical protein
LFLFWEPIYLDSALDPAPGREKDAVRAPTPYYGLYTVVQISKSCTFCAVPAPAWKKLRLRVPITGLLSTEVLNTSLQTSTGKNIVTKQKDTE